MQIGDGVGHRLLAAAEQVQERPQEDHAQHRDDGPYQQREHDRRAEDALRPRLVFHAEHDGDARGGAHADQRAERLDERHDGECEREAGDGHRPRPLPDEDTVHDIVERHRQGGNDGRYRESEKQFPYIFRL